MKFCLSHTVILYNYLFSLYFSFLGSLKWQSLYVHYKSIGISNEIIHMKDYTHDCNSMCDLLLFVISSVPVGRKEEEYSRIIILFSLWIKYNLRKKEIHKVACKVIWANQFLWLVKCHKYSYNISYTTEAICCK